MHCPPETLSPCQGSGGGAPGCSWVLTIQKPKKRVYEGKIGDKIHMLFCNEFSICIVFTGDLIVGDSTPLVEKAQGWSSWKLIGFSIVKAQENLF